MLIIQYPPFQCKKKKDFYAKILAKTAIAVLKLPFLQLSLSDRILYNRINAAIIRPLLTASGKIPNFFFDAVYKNISLSNYFKQNFAF